MGGSHGRRFAAAILALGACSSDAGLPHPGDGEPDLGGRAPVDALTPTDWATVPDLAPEPGIHLRKDRAYELAGGASGIALGDLDGDGHLDAALTGWVSGSAADFVELRYGDGAGGLGDSVKEGGGRLGSLSPVIADLNDDGRMDVAYGDYALAGPDDITQVEVLLRQGAPRALERSVAYEGGIFSSRPDLVAGDFDGDRHVDLLVDEAPGLLLLRGRGDGTFAVGATHLSLPVASMTALDLDGDGRTDVVGCDVLGQVTTVLNSPQGLALLTRTSVGAAAAYCSVVAVDLDRDGAADLVAARGKDGRLEAVVLRGRGDGTFAPPVILDAATPAGSVALVATGDFDGDRVPDVALASDGTVAVLRGRGDGTLERAVAFDPGMSPAVMAAGDLDGDGLADLLLADAPSPFVPGHLVVYLNTTGR